MDIQLIRIDDRLIHGQVVVGWVKALNIQRLVVVNDEIAKNNMRRTLMEMAVPSGLKVSFYTVEEAAGARESHPKESSLLLFSNPVDVLNFAKKGGPLTSINVGGMHFGEGKHQVSKTVCVDAADIEAFKELKGRGVELEVRAVPGDLKEPLEKFLPQLKN
jgi:mannose/fructose/sorbose-specific phosphotransferase system IIB component